MLHRKPANSRSPLITSLLILVGLFDLLLMQGCGENVKKPEERSKYQVPDSLLKSLSIDTVRIAPLVDVVRLTGIVDFDQDRLVNIYSLVSGNIQEIKVQTGDFVWKGEPLAIVRSSEMAGYSNNLVLAETNVITSKKQLDAMNDLYKSGLASVLDVTSAQAGYDQAISQLEMARRILKINGEKTNGDYPITSPINGYVVQKNVTNNTMVRADNSNNLFTVADLSDVWVQANVYEANASQVHVGDHAEVRILSAPDVIFKGQIDKIQNVLDPSSKVIKVRIILQNADNLLKPLMFASVVVSNPTGLAALCIPGKALVYDRSRYYVLRYNGRGDADIVPVEVIQSLPDKAFIRSGLREGDRIITSSTLQIYSELNN